MAAMLARLLRLLMCGFLAAFGQDLVCPMGDLYTRALPLHGYQAGGGGHQFGLPIQTDPTLLSLKRRCFRRSFTASLQPDAAISCSTCKSNDSDLPTHRVRLIQVV